MLFVLGQRKAQRQLLPLGFDHKQSDRLGYFEKIIGNIFVLPMLFVAHTKLATKLDPFLGYFEN